MLGEADVIPCRDVRLIGRSRVHPKEQVVGFGCLWIQVITDLGIELEHVGKYLQGITVSDVFD